MLRSHMGRDLQADVSVNSTELFHSSICLARSKNTSERIECRPVPECSASLLGEKAILLPQKRAAKGIYSSISPVEDADCERNTYPCTEYLVSVIVSVSIKPAYIGALVLLDILGKRSSLSSVGLCNG